jgi:hypothetical protein
MGGAFVPGGISLLCAVKVFLASIFFIAPTLAAHAVAASSATSAAQLEFFEKKIRPVLAAECYECHAGEKKKGGLQLDSRDGLLTGGDTGPAIVPGDPEKSLLITSIKQTDPDLKMPKKAPMLEPQVIADFIAWIKMGAPDPRQEPDKTTKSTATAAAWPQVFESRKKWWCFQPVRRPPIPTPKDVAWSNEPIDRFIRAGMEKAGLSPANDADPRVVYRRLCFALAGLPPTPRDVSDFAKAAAVDRRQAILDATDRLLASPAFGERWARHWMDLVRFAETFGSEHDYLNPHAWRYRDYVIRAFNADLPYDRFVQEQIAGDLLDPRWNLKLEINESLLATAWQRMIESYATPVDVKREEISVIDWQIEALGKSFLGLTIECARCHDHKFDPISATDFYALYGVFASTRPILNILDPAKKLTANDEALRTIKDELRVRLADLWQNEIAPDAIERALRSENKKDGLAPLRTLAKAKDFKGAWREAREHETKRRSLAAGDIVFADFENASDLAGWRASGPGLPRALSPPGMLSLSAGDNIVRAILPRGYLSDTVSERHGGSVRSPEFIIEKRTVSVLASGTGKARLRLVIDNFQNDLLLFEGVNPNLDSPTPRWFSMSIKDQWIGHRARIELMTRDDKTCVGYTNDQAHWAQTDGRSAFGVYRVVLHDGALEPLPSPLPREFWNAQFQSWDELPSRLADIARSAVRRWGTGYGTNEDARLLAALLECGAFPNRRGVDGKCDALMARFRELENQIPLPTRAPGVCDDASSHDCAFFPRGDHLHPGAPVPRRFLQVLGGAALGGPQSGRLALARELTRPENPLTARVMVNRIWQHLTGRGIVATPDNFGKMGAVPTHPELLDYLATRFVEEGWSVKRLIKEIVSSRTFSLSSIPNDAAAERDPANDYLSHARVMRLEAETIRDAMLTVAANMKPGHEGPGVRGFYKTQIDPDNQPPAGPIDGDGKRSVYLEARRLFPNEFLAVFDAPKPNIVTGRRSVTNVPAQSLTLLNDPFVLHEAGAWAQRMTEFAGDDSERVTQMYLAAFAREPEPAEKQHALAFIRARGDDGWRDLAHAMFNMKEFIYLP